MTDDLTALRLQFDWGVDEALGEFPVDRFAVAPRPPTVAAEPAMSAPATTGVLARTLEDLHAEIAAFTGCPLRATATHTVRPSGSATAPIVVIGDAPGSDDDRSGQAFSGPAGLIVDRVFHSVGLDRDGLMLTTLVPWRPPGNRPASESEVQACLPFVRRLLGIVRPRAVVLLGAGPVVALGGRSGTIRQLRGKWLDLDMADEQLSLQGLPFLPLNQWLKDGTSKQQLWSDLMLFQTTVTTA